MPIVPLVVLLALARPVDVYEQWEIVGSAPLLESVTARGIYHASDGPEARLPEAVQGGERPTAYSPGEIMQTLEVVQGPDGWQVRMPAGSGANVRIVGQVQRPIAGARLFRLAWPRVPATAVPVNRVAHVDRHWLIAGNGDWTCEDDGISSLPCVSTQHHPAPMALRAFPPPSQRWGLAASIASVVIALALVGVLARSKRAAAWVGAGAGALVGLSVALALAGSARLPWSQAIALTTPLAMLAGALATRTRGSSAVGGVVLLVVPLVAVIDGRLAHVLPVALLGVAGVAVSWLATRTRAAE